jgi:phosphoribosylformylglycinamidine synthase subunit PurL
MKPESLSLDLESLSLTPELLVQHSITPEEYERIVAALGRTPSLTELGIPKPFGN